MVSLRSLRRITRALPTAAAACLTTSLAGRLRPDIGSRGMFAPCMAPVLGRRRFMLL